MQSDAGTQYGSDDVGGSPSCLKRCLTIDERRASNASVPAAASESGALRDANKRTKPVEQENEVFRWWAYLSHAHQPRSDVPARS